MDDEDSIQINLISSGSFPKPKKHKLDRKHRLKKIKAVPDETDGIRIQLDEGKKTSNKESKLSKTESDPDEFSKSGFKRKRPSQEGQGESKKKKFSSLFKNNPQIPAVNNDSTVKSVTEEVFSSQRFDALDLHPFMVSNLEEKLGFTKMTTVQSQAMPHILQGRDVLIKSQTGSGKTLSYAVPVIQKLQERKPKVRRSDGPYAVIIVPTRELAIQSFTIIQKLVQPFTWIVPGWIIGGEKRKAEKARLRKGINVLVATPGRLLDHLQHTRSLTLDKVSWFIIDEADRLMEMGFEKDVSQIVSVLEEQAPPERNTVLLSATLSHGVERLAGMSLRDPVHIDITECQSDALSDESGGNEDKFATPQRLDHHLVVVPYKLRLVTLAAFILDKCKFARSSGKMLVFVATQDSVEFHYKLLSHLLHEDEDEDQLDGHKVRLFRLHGEMPQKERSQVFQEFSDVKSGVLLCTDVAARGLDLPRVNWIVQYNSPGGAADYIHRVGRTARIGTQGHALLFLAPSEVEYVKTFNKLGISFHDIAVDDILKTLLLRYQNMPKRVKIKGVVPHTPQEAATKLQIQSEVFIQDQKENRTLARKAYQSFIRSYATYPSSLKHIFHIKHLHLGHVAKSFGLQDAPTHIGAVISNQAKFNTPGKGQQKTDKKKKPGLSIKERMERAIVSEFSSGFDGAKVYKPQEKHKKKVKNRK